MIIKSKNFSLQESPKIIAEEYHNCNFSQLKPSTRIFPDDDTPRIFVECNLVNAVPPPGSTLEKCNTTQVNKMVEDGTQDLEVKGETVSIKKYKNQILGHLDTKTFKLVSKPKDIFVRPPFGSYDYKIFMLIKERQKAEALIIEKDNEADVLVKEK